MPMPAEIRAVERDDHQVADAHADLLIAARAEVGLDGLVRLEAPNLDLLDPVVWPAVWSH